MKKNINILFSFLFLLFFISCQKELHFDELPASEGTLKTDSAGINCLPMTIQGRYKVDSALGNGNYIEVNVNVTKTGDYSIQSPSSDGFYFVGTGTFSTTGIKTVRIYGFGMPTTAGLHQIYISYNNSTCIVDINVEPVTPVQNAVFTLGGAPATCSGFLLSGNYNVGLPINSSNTLTVNINVTTAGPYSLNSDTSNGVSFSASGFLSLSSTQIVLIGSGIPTGTGTNNYTLHTTTGDCTFSVTFLGPAAYTIGGAPGTCTGASPQGTYIASIPTDISNSVVVAVNVTSLGYYNIATDTVNGVVFSYTGNFTTTGPHNVTLQASGTPILASPYPFEYHLSSSSGTSSCGFTINVAGDYIVCTINGQPTTLYFNMGTGITDPTASAGFPGTAGFTILAIDGYKTLSGNYPSIHIQFNNANGPLDNITVTTSTVPSNGFLTCDYIDNTNTNYSIASNPIPAFTLAILPIQNNRCRGTFSGTLQNGSGSSVLTITNGMFDVRFR